MKRALIYSVTAGLTLVGCGNSRVTPARPQLPILGTPRLGSDAPRLSSGKKGVVSSAKLPRVFAEPLLQMGLSARTATALPNMPSVRAWVVEDQQVKCLALLLESTLPTIPSQPDLRCADPAEVQKGRLVLFFQGIPQLHGRAWFVGLSPRGTRVIRLQTATGERVNATLEQKGAWEASLLAPDNAVDTTASIVEKRGTLELPLGAIGGT